MNDKKTILQVKNTLELEKDILALFLFGSRARRTHSQESDFDFYVFLNSTSKDSLREDKINEIVSEIALKNKVTIQLTFQYLSIFDEDKSLIIKISNEGELLFAKSTLIMPFSQLGLQKYFLCKWEVDEKKIKKNKTNKSRQIRLAILRLLNGHVQKYTYKGKKQKSIKQGLIDNKGIIGNGQQLLIIDLIYDHINYLIKKKGGYLKLKGKFHKQRNEIKDFEKYKLKHKLELFLKEKNNLKKILITEITFLETDKVEIKYRIDNQIKKQTINLPNQLKHINQKLNYKYE